VSRGFQPPFCGNYTPAFQLGKSHKGTAEKL
jgi:hypothetical protein